MFLLVQSGFIRAKVVVFGQKWLYLGKSGCVRSKVGEFEKSGCNPTKVVVFGKKRLYSGKNGCIRAKVVVFGQKLVYS